MAAISLDERLHLDAREARLVVTPFIEHGFDVEKDVCAVLRAWARLFTVVGALGQACWAHKDLSFTNVRITPGGEVMLLDFDLACRLPPVERSAPDRTGTPAFQANEVLSGRMKPTAAHNLMHEIESCYWIGYFALTRLGKDPSKLMKLVYVNTLEAAQVYQTKHLHLTEIEIVEENLHTIPGVEANDLDRLVLLCRAIVKALRQGPDSGRDPTSYYSRESEARIKLWAAHVLDVAAKELAKALEQWGT